MQYQHRRARGEGSIYTKPRSPYLWIKFYQAGKPMRESTRTGDPAGAARFLRQLGTTSLPAPDQPHCPQKMPRCGMLL